MLSPFVSCATKIVRFTAQTTFISMNVHTLYLFTFSNTDSYGPALRDIGRFNNNKKK